MSPGPNRSFRPLSQYLLHAPYLTVLEADLYAMRMCRRIREDVGYDTFGKPAGGLVGLEHYRDARAGSKVGANASIGHGQPNL